MGIFHRPSPARPSIAATADERLVEDRAQAVRFPPELMPYVLDFGADLLRTGRGEVIAFIELEAATGRLSGAELVARAKAYVKRENTR